jgi:hypothetical protein
MLTIVEKIKDCFLMLRNNLTIKKIIKSDYFRALIIFIVFVIIYAMLIKLNLYLKK